MLPDFLQRYVCGGFFRILCVNVDNVAVVEILVLDLVGFFFLSPKHLLTLIFNSLKKIAVSDHFHSLLI